MEWIKVDDEIPEIERRVLVIDTSLIRLVAFIKEISVTKNKDGEIATIDWHTIHNESYWQDITHWMPLPELPKA